MTARITTPANGENDVTKNLLIWLGFYSIFALGYNMLPPWTVHINFAFRDSLHMPLPISRISFCIIEAPWSILT